MLKITFMGAGSTVFARSVLGDVMSTEALRECEIALYDIDADAASVLGMNKLERYQIHYFENRDADKVVIAGGEEVEDEANAGS